MQTPSLRIPGHADSESAQSNYRKRKCRRKPESEELNVTSKNLPAPAAVGPVLASVNCPMGVVRVTVDPAATIARAEVRTDDTTGPAADAVAKSRISQDGNRLTIVVP